MFKIGIGTAFAQVVPDSVSTENQGTDTTATSEVGDTLSTAPPDTLAQSSSVLKDEVNYSAEDSIINDLVNERVLLYGDATVSYQDITLKAERIIYDFSSYTVHAEGVQDTSGAWQGEPVFTQGSTTFEAHEMDYNFKSKKAYVKQVETEVIEGVLTGEQVKTVQDNRVIYIKNGEYCPCEDPDAKTRFKIGKLKVIKDDKIVTGPGYLALGKIPTPLAFPFGFFPNTEDRQAGLIIPSYGNAQSQGYFLADLGFYMPFSDNLDTKILADIYSRGSWGLTNQTKYVKRYKYDGQFEVQYNIGKSGDKELMNYSETRNFFVTWNHKQARSARPNSNFSADINAGSSDNFRNNLNSSQEDYLTNTFRSSIRYDKSFYDSPWSFALSAGHDQNSLTGVYNFNVPTLTLNKTRTFPFTQIFGESIGSGQAFYEKIGWTYSSSFENNLTTTESELRLDNWEDLKNSFQNGVRHQTSLSTSVKAGPFSINPNISYRERWYFKTYGREFNEEIDEFERDTIYGFDRNGDWSLGASATTKIYGMYTFKGGGLQAIRHTLTPSFSYSYRPDFDPRVYGFYGPDGTLTSYSPYENAIFGGPPSGRSQLLTVTLANNVEAKALSRRDTTSKFKKIPILENLSLRGSYNMAADSMPLSAIVLNGRTRVGKIVDLNFGAAFEPYAYIANEEGNIGRVEDFLYNRTGQLASFESGNVAVNIRGLGSSVFDRSKGPEPVAEEGEETGSEQVGDSKWFDFSDFSVPWNIDVSYVLNVNKVRESYMLAEGYAIRDSLTFTQSAQFNGGVTLFDRINISFRSGYDFVLKELTPTTFNVLVDLNCWELSANVVPFGQRRSYRLSLNIKASILQDLKLERNRSFTGEEKFFL